MVTGDDTEDLDYSDAGSVTSSEDESESDGDGIRSRSGSVASSVISLPLGTPTITVPSSATLAESEFRNEVKQSLERAFAEGHSVDNAAVELKTLRMASNVALTRVREAVIAAIVGRIRIVDGGGAAQRAEIAGVIDRWGALINKIGGVDAVETITILQVLYSRTGGVIIVLILLFSDLLCVIRTTTSFWSGSRSPVPRRHRGGG